MNENKNSVLPVIPLYYSLPLLLICISALLILVLVFKIDIPVVFLAPPNAVNVSSCGVLSQNDTYYYLNASLSFPGVSCFTIIGNNTVLDGENRQTLTGDNTPGTSAVTVRGNNVTVKGLNISFTNIGITVNNADDVLITLNMINYSNSSINSTLSSGTRVFQNVLYYPSWTAVYFESVVFGTIQQNFIFGREAVGGSSFGGVGLFNSNGNFVSENYVKNTFIAFGMQWSSDNMFSRNLADSPTSNGFFMWLSLLNRNILQHNRIIGSGSSAIYLNNVTNTLIQNTSASGTASTAYDIEANTDSANIEFVDSHVGRYIFNNSILKFRNIGNSRINFTQPVTVNGSNLSADVKLGFNYVDVNSASKPALNKSAIVTFEGLSTNFINTTIYRNGVSCPSSICTALNDLNSGNAIFTVSSWTNYSIGSGVPIGPSIDINEPDNNDVYGAANFPVLFNVDLGQNGTVWFTLNNGTTNTTMVTDDNVSFTYSQGTLVAGNYTFKAYANFTGISQTASASVNFRVVNVTIVGPPVNQSNQTNQNNSQNSTPQINFPNSTTVRRNNTNSSGSPGTSSSVEFKYVAYWLVVTVLSIAIIVLILLIIQYVRTRSVERNTIPGSIVSQLR